MSDQVTHDLGDVTLELVQGDISAQPDVEAVVNAANAQLKTGGGVAGAIHGAAGPGLAEECAPHAPIDVAEAVVTGGHELPNDHVIHVLGPRYGKDTPSDKLLAESYRNALDAAEENGVASVAFPSLSTGAFGYPIEEAAEIALQTTLEAAPELTVDTIRFVLYGEDAFATFRGALDKLR